MVAQEHQEINPLLLVHILLQALLVELVVLEARAVLRAQVALLERKGLQAIQEQQGLQEQLAILVLMV